MIRIQNIPMHVKEKCMFRENYSNFNRIASKCFLLQKFHKKELNIKQLGFMSMVEFMSAMPDVVRIERPTKLDWLLFLAKGAMQ